VLVLSPLIVVPFKPVRALQTATPASLEQLMTGYQAGDRAAADAFADQCSAILLRFFVSRGSSRQEAGDLLQDTWLRIHKARHSWRPNEPVVPWLLAIARHTRADAWRKAYRSTQREASLEGAAEPVSAQSFNEEAGDVQRLLLHLPESQREVLILLKVLGLSIDEAARATSTTAGAVKQKAHRAYETLRRVLASSPARGKERT
jgi:RNA polymerase sigma-70 factor, ECF subfamily